MSGWHPIHDNHAIDVMAAVVTFSEPIPHRVLARALRAADEVAIPAGLNSRHSTDTMQFIVGPQGISTPAVAPANVQGLRFNAIFKNGDGTPVLGKIAEQLQVDANSIVYRTWRYVSWSWQLDRMRSLMASPFAAVSDVVSVMSTRLEYLDRFWFDGEPQDAPTSEAGHIRSLGESSCNRVFCIYDQTVTRADATLPAVPTHAGIFGRHPPPKTPIERKSRRISLDCFESSLSLANCRSQISVADC